MLNRRIMLLFSLILMAGIAGAQAQNVDTVFPENDTFRVIAEPITVGVDAFSARLDKIRAEGREPIGLVLAGGSARAYAHIGVLQALEDAGIRPDFIVANSMGAVVGMLYAAGLSTLRHSRSRQLHSPRILLQPRSSHERRAHQRGPLCRRHRGNRRPPRSLPNADPHHRDGGRPEDEAAGRIGLWAIFPRLWRRPLPCRRFSSPYPSGISFSSMGEPQILFPPRSPPIIHPASLSRRRSTTKR